MAGSHSSSMSLGDDSATDMTSGGETGTSNPWFEFSDLDLTFVPEGQPSGRRFGGVKHGERMHGGEGMEIY